MLPVPPNEVIQLNDTLPHLSPGYALNSIDGDATPHGIGGSALYDVDEAMSSGGGDSDDADNHGDFKALIQTPLEPGKTLIIYHPHAQHQPEITTTATLSLTREPQPAPLPATPWAPFSSRDDFEQAELFIKHGCSNRLINDQLNLNQKRDSCDCHPDNPPPMRNARDLHRVLEGAGSDLDISLVGWVSLCPIGSTDTNEE